SKPDNFSSIVPTYSFCEGNYLKSTNYLFTRVIVKPSRIGNNTDSTLGSVLIFVLYALMATADLSFGFTSSKTLPDHNTLSDKITPPGFIFGKTKSKSVV